MKKSELIARLNEVDGDPDVMLAADSEGNGFSAAFAVEHSPVNYEGEPCHVDDADPDGERLIVLWP